MNKSYWLILFFFIPILSFAQDIAKVQSKVGWFSLGGRSSLSLFNKDGAGLGTGGQFRIQFSDRVNSEWFADYIVINISDKVRSEYYHIGWSVMFYPLAKMQFPKVLQPYILAGHCFDYNKKTLINQPAISKNRWGSAVQAGIGTHFHVTEKFDISLTCQYMIHLTKELETEIDGSNVSINEHDHSSLEGHLIATASINYKLFKLWGRD